MPNNSNNTTSKPKKLKKGFLVFPSARILAVIRTGRGIMLRAKDGSEPDNKTWSDS